MKGEKALSIHFFDLHGFMFSDDDIEHQRVCFRTRPGLHHEALKVAITCLTKCVPENLTWDATCGEGSFCLLTASASSGIYALPYREEKDR
ncbi:hypothetical protein V2154_23855 [Ewingella sp. CoE-038-23]|uniref:hypothetical protein n=1 Tax=Ewingella docleensis TaxID=3118588 RepID=UPI003365A3E8